MLGAYILMFPQARVNVLVGRQLVAMPAFIVLGMWIALQLVSGVGTIAATDESAGGVAYMAHIGGFVAGLLMTFLFRGRDKLRHRHLKASAFRSQPRKSRLPMSTPQLLRMS